MSDEGAAEDIVLTIGTLYNLSEVVQEVIPLRRAYLSTKLRGRISREAPAFLLSIVFSSESFASFCLIYGISRIYRVVFKACHCIDLFVFLLVVINVLGMGHTVKFRTRRKSYKNKHKIENPKEDWLIFENTHEPIITQQEFDLVQELRSNKRRNQKQEAVNPFSGVCYCADCGKKLYLCRSRSLSEDQEHLKCSTHSADKNSCSAHYIRTVVLKELVLNALNKLLDNVKDNEAEFVQTAMDNSASKHSSDVFKAKKLSIRLKSELLNLTGFLQGFTMITQDT